MLKSLKVNYFLLSLILLFRQNNDYLTLTKTNRNPIWLLNEKYL